MDKIYICISETYDDRFERLLDVGLVGCFDTLQKALDAANECVPDGHELDEKNMSTMFCTISFTFCISIREIELNHHYKAEESWN